MNIDMAMTYLEFVENRHRIYELRRDGAEGPWTDDLILRRHKFTNVFRVLDYGSQFLLRELLTERSLDPGEALMRCFLYRYTNRPEPWIAFKEEFGRMPVRTDLERNLPDLWREYRDGWKRPVFGNAFKMFSGAENKGTDRLTWVLGLAQDYFGYGRADVTEAFLRANMMSVRMMVLTALPRCGSFMGMQILTDFGYFDPMHDENSFVVPGPGAVVGAKELGLKPYTAIEWCRRAIIESNHGVLLGTRPPSYMDVQNTLCEFGKYIRYTRKPLPHRDFKPAHADKLPTPVLPNHWK